MSIHYSILQAINGVGGICQFKLDINANSPFTGLFQPGQISGLIRLGAAKEYVNDDFLPGIGIKFLRTGVSSGNFVGLNSLNAQTGSWDMFQSEMYNHVSPIVEGIAETVLAQRFCQTNHCITKVGLSNVCKYDQDGNEVADPIFPFKVTLTPKDQGFSKDQPGSIAELQKQFANIAPGSKLYTLTAMQSPDDVEGIYLGDLVSDGQCVTGSNFGDNKLFFKHQWINEDINLRPEWRDAYLDGCYCNGNKNIFS